MTICCSFDFPKKLRGMKKKILLMAAGMVGMFLMSCDYRTCPTYTKKPANFEQLERLDSEDNSKQRTIRERV